MSTSDRKNAREDFRYERRILAYLDILGWKDLIALSLRRRSGISRVSATVRALKRAEKIRNETTEAMRKNGEENRAVEMTMFSDTVVLSCLADGDLRLLLAWLNRFRLNLLLKGIYTRGAIVRGLLFHKDGVIVGPALVEAFRLESTVAKSPRILVADEFYPHLIAGAFVNDAGEREELAIHDGDTLPVLNPFVGIGEFGELDYSKLPAALNRVQRDLTRYSGDAGVRSKLGSLHRFLSEQTANRSSRLQSRASADALTSSRKTRR